MAIKRVAGIVVDAISGATIGYCEQRGDRSLTILNEDSGKRERLGHHETLLLEGARNELRQARYPTDLEIVDANQTPGADLPEALENATNRVAKREGHTSRLWLAMRYLGQRLLLVCRALAARDQDADTVANVAIGSAVVFAIARQEWHEAFHGTDDAAYHGRRQGQRLKKGPASRRGTTQNRDAAIVRALGSDIDNKAIALTTLSERRLKSVNAALVEAKEKPFESGASLYSRLKVIRRARLERMAISSRA